MKSLASNGSVALLLLTCGCGGSVRAAAGGGASDGGASDGGASDGSRTATVCTRVVRPQAVDKLDVLLMIDNSASMGDKQDYLAAAVPDLVARLVTPNCVDTMNNVVGV